MNEEYGCGINQSENKMENVDEKVKGRNYDEVVYTSRESLAEYEQKKQQRQDEMQSNNYMNQMRQAYHGNSYYDGQNQSMRNMYGPYTTANVYEQTDETNRNETQNDSYIHVCEDVDYSEEKKEKAKKASKNNKKKQGKVAKTFKKCVSIVVAAAVFGTVTGGAFNLVTNGTLFPNTQKESDDKLSMETAENANEREDFFGKEDSSDNSQSAAENPQVTIPTTNAFNDGSTNSQSLDVSSIAESVMPSVVAITVEAVEQIQNFFGQVQQYQVEGSGSGIIIGQNETELLVVTNNHVVSGATTVSVQFIDGEVYEAGVKGTDSDNDLAILSLKLADIKQDTIDQIKVAKIGSSDDLKIGEQVVAIGNALGYGQSVTTGIVSAKDRVVDTNATPLIQTDAAINPGNSGGALLNMKGEVIGINSSKYASTEVEGMGYAIPISQVEEILDELMNRETREKVSSEDQGYLGISCSTISQDTYEMYGIPTGVFISEVMEGGACDKAGLKERVVITKFDGISVSTADELVNLLQYYEAGEIVTITYMEPSGGEYTEKTVDVCLGKKAN